MRLELSAPRGRKTVSGRDGVSGQLPVEDLIANSNSALETLERAVGAWRDSAGAQVLRSEEGARRAARERTALSDQLNAEKRRVRALRDANRSVATTLVQAMEAVRGVLERKAGDRAPVETGIRGQEAVEAADNRGA